MSIKSVLAALALAVPALVLAQSSIGSFSNVQGQVTVSSGSSATAAQAGGAVTDGAFIVTGATGSVTVTLNNGCVVVLQPNQSLAVSSNLTCAQLLASVKPVPAGGAFAGAAGGAGGGAAVNAFWAAYALAGAKILHSSSSND
ncbi:MAG TPA: hypothetical protein VLJ58_05615 [Ramlibacter sp.]|nr:hypothetical protein [Ramlibacter sp.]